MENKIRQYITKWEQRCYPNGLPDEAPIEINDMVPSFKRIAIAILKNDYPLKSLGFTPIVSKFYTELKGIEIAERNKQSEFSVSSENIVE